MYEASGDVTRFFVSANLPTFNPMHPYVQLVPNYKFFKGASSFGRTDGLGTTPIFDPNHPANGLLDPLADPATALSAAAAQQGITGAQLQAALGIEAKELSPNQTAPQQTAIGFTNPIFLDLNGDQEFDPPGVLP